MLNSVRPSPLPQIHAHYELKKTSRHRRNLAITGGVALSIITAPVIAAVSVGKKPDGAVRYYVSRSFEDDGQEKKKGKRTVCLDTSLVIASNKERALMQNEKYCMFLVLLQFIQLILCASSYVKAK